MDDAASTYPFKPEPLLRRCYMYRFSLYSNESEPIMTDKLSQHRTHAHQLFNRCLCVSRGRTKGMNHAKLSERWMMPPACFLSSLRLCFEDVIVSMKEKADA
jgi:hypothetical protein